MEIRCVSKEQRIEEAKKNLEQVKRIAENGGYVSKVDALNHIDLAEKELAYVKGRISFKTYWEAHLKIYGKKVV